MCFCDICVCVGLLPNRAPPIPFSEYQTALDVEAQERSSGGIVTAAREETLNQRALCLRALGRYDDAIHEFIS